tara:strand:- start:515 stop:739 length:225 start_codon:yes stop_codon:yes gene_type:complete
MGQANLINQANAQRLLLYHLVYHFFSVIVVIIVRTGVAFVFFTSSERDKGGEGKDYLQHDVPPSAGNSAGSFIP